MPDTVQSALLIGLLVLPGFILVGVSRVGRRPGTPEADLVLVLRSFAIAVVIQIPVFPLWTEPLIEDADGSFQGLLNIPVEASLYAAVVLLGVPVLLGLLLRWVLDRAERKRVLRPVERLLGARLQDTAWDVALSQLEDGDLLILNLTDNRTIAGRWVGGSWATEGESKGPGIFLTRLTVLDAEGRPARELPVEWGGTWVPQENIVSFTRYRPTIDSRPAEGSEDDVSNGAASGQPSQPAKVIALLVLVAGFGVAFLVCGLAGVSREEAFKVDTADFAFFAAFIVVAGAIERFLEPVAKALPPTGTTPKDKADRALYLASLALVIGIVVSATFGLYFMEAIGVKIGSPETPGPQSLAPESDGDKLLRGLDIFITALVITGGTKPLHDLITRLEKQKEAAAAGAAERTTS